MKYQNLAMKIIRANGDPELLLTVYFHDDNVKYIIDITTEILKDTNLNVDDYKDTLEKRIFAKMIKIYQDTIMEDRENLKELVTKLNRRLVKETVTSIIIGVQNFEKYKSDFIKGNPDPLELPKYMSSKKSPYDTTYKTSWNPGYC